MGTLLYRIKIKLFLSALVMTFSFSAAQAQSKIEFIKVKEVKITSLGFSKIELSGKLVLYNNLRLAAKIKTVQVDVFMDDEHLWTIHESIPIKLRKRQATDIPLLLNAKLTRTLRKAFGNTKNLINGQAIELKYKGEVKVKALGIITKTIQFEDNIEVKLSDLF